MERDQTLRRIHVRGRSGCPSSADACLILIFSLRRRHELRRLWAPEDVLRQEGFSYLPRFRYGPWQGVFGVFRQ